MIDALRSPDLTFSLPTGPRATAGESEFQQADSRAYLGSKTVQPMGGSSDVDTDKPIAGAVVLAVWWEAVFSPVGHPTEKFYDAREAVTDSEGRFEIPPLPVPWTLGVQPPEFYWFAPGYDTVKVIGDSPYGKRRYIVPTVIEMRRLKTKKELLERLSSRPLRVPLPKMKELTKAINIERKMLGLEPLPISAEENR